jgi:hypothetical protein
MESGLAQTTEQGLPAISVTYVSNSTQALNCIVYLSLQNKAGATVYLASLSMPLVSKGNATVTISFGGLDPGTYSARVFAITSKGVPVTETSVLDVTVS